MWGAKDDKVSAHKHILSDFVIMNEYHISYIVCAEYHGVFSDYCVILASYLHPIADYYIILVINTVPLLIVFKSSLSP